jgi:hypothetical protein
MSKLAKALTAAAGNAGGGNLYVEDVFSTYLYEGTGTAQTITNGIDLDGEGGMVWVKARNYSSPHSLADTERGRGSWLDSSSTAAAGSPTATEWFTSFNSDGFSLGDNWQNENRAGIDTCSWTFRKAEKFFDVVTYTGNGSTQTINHNLGSAPGCIIVKSTSASDSNWFVYHRSLGVDAFLILNLTNAAFGYNGGFSNITSTSFGVADSNNVNGLTYVAYLFAHDAGGFGDDGDESIIKCGSYNSSNAAEISVNVGFEPQFIIYKDSSATGEWYMQDVMRGNTASATAEVLRANNSAAEYYSTLMPYPTATGFNVPSGWGAGNTYIYIAIRRPMKTPESGTEVFSVSDSMSGAVQPAFDAPHVVDMAFQRRPAFTQTTHIASRLTGTNNLYTDTTAAEVSQVENVWDFMDGWGGWSVTNTDYRAWNFKRATGFFDVVAYSAVGSSLTTNHNLGVAPEAVIVKKRSGSANWTWSSNFGGTLVQMELNLNSASSPTNGYINSVTSTTFTTGGSGAVISTGDYIAYLFATLAGVSKVGSYTGTGADLNVDCGF